MTMNDQFVLWFVTLGTMAIYFLAAAITILAIAATIHHFTEINIFKWAYKRFF